MSCFSGARKVARHIYGEQRSCKQMCIIALVSNYKSCCPKGQVALRCKAELCIVLLTNQRFVSKTNKVCKNLKRYFLGFAYKSEICKQNDAS